MKTCREAPRARLQLRSWVPDRPTGSETFQAHMGDKGNFPHSKATCRPEGSPARLKPEVEARARGGLWAPGAPGGQAA